MVYFAAMNPSENEWFVAGRLQKMSNFIWLAPSFALSASEGHSRRGAFTLSLPNVPIYPERSRRTRRASAISSKVRNKLCLFFCTRDFLGTPFPYNTTNESAIFHHFGRFQSGNFRFHTKFSFRFWFSPSQTKEWNETRILSGGSPPVFLFPPLLNTLLL